MAIRITFILGLLLIGAAWLAERDAAERCETRHTKSTCFLAMR